MTRLACFNLDLYAHRILIGQNIYLRLCEIGVSPWLPPPRVIVRTPPPVLSFAPPPGPYNPLCPSLFPCLSVVGRPAREAEGCRLQSAPDGDARGFVPPPYRILLYVSMALIG